jgi:hypothetical protein
LRFTSFHPIICCKRYAIFREAPETASRRHDKSRYNSHLPWQNKKMAGKDRNSLNIQ